MRKTLFSLFIASLVFVGASTLHAGALEARDAKKETIQKLQEKVLATYESQIGVRENLGTNDSKEIREYLRSVGIKTPAYYCAAFVCWGLTVNGIDNPRTGWSPALFPTDHLVNLKTSTPEPCDAFGIYHNDLKRIAHAGTVKYWPRDTNYFISIEGNTNNNGSRNGDGVYEKRRPKRSVAKVSRWIGWRI